MLIPKFNQAKVDRKIDSFVRNKEKTLVLILAYIGEKYVNDARRNHTYTDQTGNLTASIGYIVAFQKEILKENVYGEAKQVALEVLDELNPSGYILIVIAGMEYAAAVESKGYDVITGSAPAAQELANYLKKELGLAE